MKPAMLSIFVGRLLRRDHLRHRRYGVRTQSRIEGIDGLHSVCFLIQSCRRGLEHRMKCRYIELACTSRELPRGNPPAITR